ncbi:MAG TPA: tetratricopeptide repeat protein, partial [Chroococcidiopsis sp.]
MNARHIAAYFLIALGLPSSLGLDAIASPAPFHAQVAQVPNSRELVRQGNQFRQAGQLSQAAAAYRAAIQLEPDYPPAHNNLGLILYE